MIRKLLLAAAFGLVVTGTALSPVSATDAPQLDLIVSEIVVSQDTLSNQVSTLDDNHENTAQGNDDINQCNGC
jgi:hypothetical protein